MMAIDTRSVCIIVEVKGLFAERRHQTNIIGEAYHRGKVR